MILQLYSAMTFFGCAFVTEMNDFGRSRWRPQFFRPSNLKLDLFAI